MDSRDTQCKVLSHYTLIDIMTNPIVWARMRISLKASKLIRANTRLSPEVMQILRLFEKIAH